MLLCVCVCSVDRKGQTGARTAKAELVPAKVVHAGSTRYHQATGFNSHASTTGITSYNTPPVHRSAASIKTGSRRLAEAFKASVEMSRSRRSSASPRWLEEERTFLCSGHSAHHAGICGDSRTSPCSKEDAWAPDTVGARSRASFIVKSSTLVVVPDQHQILLP
eukprot:GHVU01178512.1.p1 GENE.GHVU01178512.1~~GHVU01178512.1.p1  ORF type:complete len:164 (+),score=9.62 GHVU01178512.1:697-1188(+)